MLLITACLSIWLLASIIFSIYVEPWSLNTLLKSRPVNADIIRSVESVDTQPDTDLHAITPDGRHVGMDYETGEYENEIEGSIVSGDLFNDHEWILVPEHEQDVQFYVSSHDTQAFLEANPDIAASLTEEEQTESYSLYTKAIDPEQGIFASEETTVQLQPGDQSYHILTGTPDAPGVSPGQPTPYDLTPPTTTAALSGTLGTDDWYTTPVTVTLSATDDAEGSGVASTRYSLDAGTTWQDYTAPLILSEDGQYSLQFFSSDAEGNEEAIQTLPLAIDQTPPATPLRPGAEATSSSVTLSWHPTTDATSGIAFYTVYRDGSEVGTTTTSTFTDTGLRRFRFYEYTVTATDLAGNTSPPSEDVRAITFRGYSRPAEEPSDDSGDGDDGSASKGGSVQISASSSSINGVSTATITWEVTGYTECTGSGGWSGPQPLTGSMTITPQGTTTYTLTCTDGSSTGTGSVTVSGSSSSSSGSGSSWWLR